MDIFIKLLLLLVPLSAAGETNVGLSYIGLCNKTWDCEASLSPFSDHINFGFLFASFGKACPCGRRVLSDNRPKLARISAINASCLRFPGRCSKLEPYFGESVRSAQRKIRSGNARLLQRIESHFSQLAAFLQANAVEPFNCLVSPELESNFDPPARRVLLSIASRHFPQCSLVDNPMRGPCVKGYLCEKHGAAPEAKPPCIIDNDGNSVSPKSFIARGRGCVMTLLWEPEFNCRRDSGFIFPHLRRCLGTARTFGKYRRYLR